MSGKSSSKVQRSCESSHRTWETSPAPLKMDKRMMSGIPKSRGLEVWKANVRPVQPLSLTLGAGVSTPSQVAVAARAAAVVVIQTEAVRWADGVIAGQVVNSRRITFPGRHGRSGVGGGGGGKAGAGNSEEAKI